MAKRSETPSALDTPSDLSANSVGAVADAVNGLVASNFTLYVKTKNFHWHMSGPHFRDYHLLLDEQGAQIYETIDPLAERVRKLGRQTVKSIGEISRLSAIKDNDADFVGPGEMLNELVRDNLACIAKMREAHTLCDEAGDVATASLLETQIDDAERRVWFLSEAGRGADRSGH